ncbi:MAG: hypothetical protein C0483_20155 [Pirellula sp.]|nr:hypothetical protein [Pirellula sp.]
MRSISECEGQNEKGLAASPPQVLDRKTYPDFIPFKARFQPGFSPATRLATRIGVAKLLPCTLARSGSNSGRILPTIRRREGNMTASISQPPPGFHFELRPARRRRLCSVLLWPALLWSITAQMLSAAEPRALPSGEVSARSFVDTSQIVSNFAKEQYAHQCTMRIVDGIGYVAYQCNESTPEENQAGQVVRLAIFNILNPTATAKWIDVSGPNDSSGGITITGTFVASPILHSIGDATDGSHAIRIFFASRQEGDTVPIFRVFYKDYSIADGKLGELRQVRCSIGKQPAELHDLSMPVVQRHLDFLFGPGVGEPFSKGITPTCDMVSIDGTLYSTIQIKNSADGRTLLMTNVLMRSTDEGATWELLGAPDPRLLPGDAPDAVKILAEPALSHDGANIYLHLRTNQATTGYVLSKAPKSDLYNFDAPETKWTYGIGRPAICDFGKPIGTVALFTAPSVTLGGAGVSRNRLDVVQIDRTYKAYSRAFSIVDYNAVNTPFICPYNDEMYVAYTTGKRRLIPKFGTSEIVFTKLRREFFVDTQARD